MASSHLRRGLFGSSAAVMAKPGFEDCRREVEERGLEELRRGPAFWSVFCRVISWLVAPRWRMGWNSGWESGRWGGSSVVGAG